MNKINRRNILLFSILGTAYLLFATYYPDICAYKNWCEDYTSTVDMLEFFTVPAPLLFLFSLVTYRMADEVFERWRNFSLWYLPIFTLLMLPLTASTGSGFGGLIQKGINNMLIILFVFAYFVTSTVLIIRKRNELKKSEQRKLQRN